MKQEALRQRNRQYQPIGVTKVVFSLSSGWLPASTPTVMLLVQKQLLCISLCCLILFRRQEGSKDLRGFISAVLMEILLEGRDELEIMTRQWLNITPSVHLTFLFSVLLVGWLILVGAVREAKQKGSPISALFQSQYKHETFCRISVHHVYCTSNIYILFLSPESVKETWFFS